MYVFATVQRSIASANNLQILINFSSSKRREQSEMKAHFVVTVPHLAAWLCCFYSISRCSHLHALPSPPSRLRLRCRSESESPSDSKSSLNVNFELRNFSCQTLLAGKMGAAKGSLSVCRSVCVCMSMCVDVDVQLRQGAVSMATRE